MIGARSTSPDLLQQDIYRRIVLAWQTFLAPLLALLTRALFFCEAGDLLGDCEVLPETPGCSEVRLAPRGNSVLYPKSCFDFPSTSHACAKQQTRLVWGKGRYELPSAKMDKWASLPGCGFCEASNGDSASNWSTDI